MTPAAWLRAEPRRVNAAAWLACGLLAAAFLAPAIVQGAFGPADMLLGMTPWSAYRERFADVRGVANPQLDVIQQYVPWRLYAADCLRHNIVPLWNPHAYCGQPFVGNVLSAVFYPFGALACVVPIGTYFLLSAWAHLTLLGGGLWLLLRGYRLRWFAALGGAAVMMLNGFVIGWLAYAPLAQWTFAWAPLAIWSWRRAWLARRPRRLVGTALILAVAVLGGHVQIAFAVGLAWLLVALVTLAAERRWRDAPLWLALPAAAAGALAALQLLPAYEMAQLSGRGAQPLGAVLGARLPPAMAVLLWVPHFFGHNAVQIPVVIGGVPQLAGFWGPYTNGVEASVSSGAGALWLSVVALLWRRDRAVWPWAAVALVGPLLAFGTPLYALAYHLVPGFSALSGLGRWMCLWCLGTAALSGFGLDALARAEPSRPCPRRAGLLFVAGTVVVLLLGFAAEAGAEGRPTAFTPGCASYVLSRCAVALGASLAVALVTARRARRAAPWLALLVAAELFLLGRPLHRGAPPELFFFDTPETKQLQAVAEPFRLVGVAADPARGFLDWFPMNTPMAYGLSSPTGSESLSLAAWRRRLAGFCEPGWEPRLDSPWLDLVGVRFALSRAELSERGWPRVGGERVGLFQNPEALPLIFATPRWTRVDEGELEARLAGPFDPTQALLSPTAPAPSLEAPLAPRYVSLDATRATPQRWIATGAPAARCAVVFTTPTQLGWQAYFNGARASLEPAFGLFGAVIVEAGPVSVRFVYQPTAYRLGLFLSLAAVAALAAGWVAGQEGQR